MKGIPDGYQFFVGAVGGEVWASLVAQTVKNLPKFFNTRCGFGLFFQLCHMACRILSPNQGIKPEPLQWTHKVLTTGFPGKSLMILK